MKLRSPQKAVADLIIKAYASIPMSIRAKAPTCTQEMTATVNAPGLGDMMMLTDLPFAANQIKRTVHVWSASAYFGDIMQFHPTNPKQNNDFGVMNPYMCEILRLREVFDLGNGHQLQQLRRAWNLPVDYLPMGRMNRTEEPYENRVIMHFEPSQRNVSWQRQYWHPRMREFYPESILELQRFIKSRPDLEFVQIGQTPMNIKGAKYIQCSSITDLIKTIQTGTWFIGIMSGPMHIAVAYNLRCVVVVNYPSARRIVLPCLKWTGTPEEEWMYPQNVHLHQDNESPLVPRFSRDSLSAAFNGDVYPFWQHDWLDLIDHKL